MAEALLVTESREVERLKAWLAVMILLAHGLALSCEDMPTERRAHALTAIDEARRALEAGHG